MVKVSDSEDQQQFYIFIFGFPVDFLFNHFYINQSLFQPQ